MAATKADAPLVCLVLGFFVGLLAAVLLWGWRLDVLSRSALYPVSGRVEAIEITTSPKFRAQLNIYVRDSARLWHLTQNDLRSDIPSIRAIRVGDVISARVGSDFLRRDINWLWELQRRDEVPLTYDQTLSALQRQAEPGRSVGFGASVVLVFCLLSAGSFVIVTELGRGRASSACIGRLCDGRLGTPGDA